MAGRQVGCLGGVVFEVSDRKVQTIQNAQWSGSARYAVHQRHLNDAATELTGSDPDQFSFDMYLSYSLNVNVLSTVVELWNYMRTGKALRLVIGEKTYGKHRWNITSLNVKMQQYDMRGSLIGATVSLTLQECVNW